MSTILERTYDPRMNIDFDVTEVCKAFLRGELEADRDYLMQKLNAAQRDNRAMRELFASICGEVMSQQLKPTDGIGTGMLYGLVIGVLLERERQARKRKAS